jgi:hypothetical protein
MCRYINHSIFLLTVSFSDLASANEWTDSVVAGSNIAWNQGSIKVGNAVFGVVSRYTMQLVCELIIICDNNLRMVPLHLLISKEIVEQDKIQ